MSTAVERYEIFERLKNQFDINSEKGNVSTQENRGGAVSKKLIKQDNNISNKKAETRDFNRKLKEVSSIRKETLPQKAEYVSKTLMVGEWRNTDFTKALRKASDSDAIETASVASCDSAAYSSKSGSSFMSPLAGSCTELSDAGSADTYLEYDIYPSQTKNTCKSNSDCTRPLDQLSPDQVSVNTRLWNKLIEGWTLDSTPTPTLASKGRMTSQFEASTPSSSTENLLDDVHSTSVCTDSGCLSENSSEKFAWQAKGREEHTAEDSVEEDATTAMKLGGPTRVLDVRDDTTTAEMACPDKNGSEGVKDVKNGTQVVEKEPNIETIAEQVRAAAIGSGTVIQIKAADHQEGKQPALSSCTRPNIQSVSARIKMLKRSQSESAIMTDSSSTNATRRSKFGEAYKQYRELQTLSESPSPSGRRRNLVSVKERAQLFGQK